jgi:ankyrin repeat protein
MEARLKSLPASPDPAHLKKQAKHLLRDAHAGDAGALARFAQALPAAHNRYLATHELKLHDAQSVISREYGFLSWVELKRYVQWKRTETSARITQWLEWCFEGGARERRLARRFVDAEPQLFSRDPWFACILGDEQRVAAALAADPDFAKKPGGPVAMLPLLAVTHSKLIVDGRAEDYLGCARLLIEHGADVDATWIDPRWPDNPLSALYGAAGRSHNVALVGLLLDAGANPDDNESLYHSVEASDDTCTKLLLAAGARVNGTNALGRVLDFDRLDRLKMLLAHGGDPDEKPWTHHAILRGRSLAHIQAMLEAGADPNGKREDGTSLYASAALFGRTDVVALLESLGVKEDLPAEAAFIAACSRGDLDAAERIKSKHPDILERLSARQLQLMPDLAAIGRIDAVRTMLAVGWPREIKTAWQATALNLAIFQGDAELVALLLDEGADWRTMHGFGDNALGTLSFACQADEIADPAPRDYVGCARELLTHGVPKSEFERYGFSTEVADYLVMPA